MSNLLPLASRSEVWEGRQTRIVMTSAGSLMVAALLCIAGLLPSMFILRAQKLDAADAGDQSPSAESQGIIDAQAVLSQVAPYYATSSPAGLAAEIVAKRPKGLTITHITYALGKPSSIILRGSAAKRDDVNAYRAALAQDPRFSDVSVPISALVGTENRDFTLTVTGPF